MKKKTSRLIIEGSDGDPRKVATSNPYDPTSQDTPYTYEDRGQPKAHLSHMGKMAKSASVRRKGSTNINMSSAMQSGSSMQSAAQAPLYYDYRWSTPDKYYFPRNRVVANAIWREIYRRDAVIATATDMYAEMPCSDFDLSGLDDPVVKHTYETMFSNLNLVSKLPDFIKDYLITGECFLHALFNDTTGLWSRAESFNPDFIRVQGVGIAAENPLLWLLPTPELKKIINATDPRVRKLQKSLPRELVNAVRMNKEVPLDSLNTTFIARFRNSTDLRGSSIFTRVYRVIMYEDFIVNASLAIAQRHAAPLRLFKMGDPNTGWLPTDEDIASFMEQLSMAESDPLSAIVTHSNVTCDLVGVSDRVLLISKEWDFIERMKLLAMGISKSILTGEGSFAGSASGMQILTERLLNLRTKFEQEWILKKLCVPIAKIHRFYKRPKSELDHRIRVKTTDDMIPLVPKIKWKKILEPSQEIALLNVWRDLKERGLLSDRTYAQGANVDLDVERRNAEEEIAYRKEFIEKYGTPPEAQKQPAGGMSGAGPSLAAPPPSEGDMAPEAPAEEAPAEVMPEQTPEPMSPPGSSALVDKINETVDSTVEEIRDLRYNLSKGSKRKLPEEATLEDIEENLERNREEILRSLSKDIGNSDFLIGK